MKRGISILKAFDTPMPNSSSGGLINNVRVITGRKN
jgi:hypothetical protein